MDIYKRRIKNLLVRLGDEGTRCYNLNLVKITEVTPQFIGDESKK